MTKFSPGLITRQQADALNDMSDMLARLRQMRGTNPIQVDWQSNSAPSIRFIENGDLPFRAFDSAVMSSGLQSGQVPNSGCLGILSGAVVYSWIEQWYDNYGNRMDAVSGMYGASGFPLDMTSTSNPLYEVNNLSIPVSSGSSYLGFAKRHGTAGDLGAAYEFDGTVTGEVPITDHETSGTISLNNGPFDGGTSGSPVQILGQGPKFADQFI